MNSQFKSVNGKQLKVVQETIDGQEWISFNGWTFSREITHGKRYRKSATTSSQNSNEIVSPMPGHLLKVLVNSGDTVEENQTLCIVEAMKMEHSLKAKRSGIIENVLFSEGAALKINDVIITMDNQQP